jgi:hypothetical protein
LRTTEIAMLLEERHTQSGLLCHSTFSGFLNSGDQSEKSGLPASIAAKDCPAVTIANRERYTFEYPGCAKLHTGIRNGDLCQARSTLEQAERQRSRVSSV